MLRDHRFRHPWGVAALLSLIFVGLAAPIGVVAIQQQQASTDPGDASIIESLNADLARATNPADRARIQAKIDSLRQHGAPAAAPPAHSKSADNLAPSPVPRTPRHGGITDNIVPPISGGYARVTNAWSSDEAPDGSSTEVYAGAFVQEPSQGVLFVFHNSPGSAAVGPRQEIRSPKAAGILRIVAAQGTFLTVSAADGTQLVFDVTTSSFR